MQEIKFNIYGEMFHSNGYSRNEILSYIASSREEALATCKRLNPKFHVMSIWEDESEVEVVKVQSLIWWTQQQQLIQFKLQHLEGIYRF